MRREDSGSTHSPTRNAKPNPTEPRHLIGSGSNHRSGPMAANTLTMQSQFEFIEKWLQGTTPPDPNCSTIAERRRKRGEMATPPPSHSRALSPAKRRRTDGWTSEDGAGPGDPEKTPTANPSCPTRPPCQERLLRSHGGPTLGQTHHDQLPPHLSASQAPPGRAPRAPLAARRSGRGRVQPARPRRPPR